MKLDRIVAAGVAVIGVVQIFAGNALPGPRPVAVLVVLGLAATVAVRRRWPLAAGVAALALVTVQNLAGGYGSSVVEAVGWMCGLYAIAVWTDTRGFVIGVAALAALNALSLLGPPPQRYQDTVLFTVVPAVAMVLLRAAVRGRQLRAEALAARAEVAERDAAQAVLDERARIARELHDVVAHTSASWSCRPAAERRRLLDDDPDRDARARSRRSSRPAAQALAEMRRLLGLLREGDAGRRAAPQPAWTASTIARRASVRDAGLPVERDHRGRARRRCPPGVDLSAYRIVQEALTNALKHAGARARARVRVALRARRRSRSTSATTARRPTATGDGAGHGLVGMRERVALFGGDARRRPAARRRLRRPGPSAVRRARDDPRARRRRPGAGARRVPH